MAIYAQDVASFTVQNILQFKDIEGHVYVQ